MNQLVKLSLAVLLALGSLSACSNNSASSGQNTSSESENSSSSDSSSDEESKESEETTEDSENSEESSYKDSLELIDALYEKMQSADAELPSIVGGYGDEMVSDAPAALDTQSEVTAQALALPLEVLNEAVSAASFSHAIMANNLTVVVMEFVSGTDLEDLAAQIEEQVKNNEWVCSIPERFEIYSTGNYLLYAFGSNDLLDIFNEAANQLEPTPIELANQPIE